MSYLSIGDLAQSLQLRHDNARIRADLDRLSRELSTGLKQDVTAAVSGDFGALGSIEGAITRLQSLTYAAKETTVQTTAAQQVFGLIQQNMGELSGALLLNQGTSQPALVDAVATDARVRMESVVAALNTQTAGRSLFAGAATDRPALTDVTTMLDDLTAIAASQTSALGVATTIDTWFAPGGGFDTSGYLGSLASTSPVMVAEGELAALSITAASAEVRALLSAFAKAAILERGVLAGNPGERSVLARSAGEAMLTAETGVVDLRTQIGAREEQIDRALARNQAELSAFEMSRNDLTSADPFRTATDLKSAEAQLEALYTLTARLSRLTLTEFLR